MANDGWVLTAFSRYCPDCLRDTADLPGGPVWDGTWRLPHTFLCERHNRILAWRCPACHAPAFSNGYRADGRWRPTQLVPAPAQRLHPIRCRHPPPRHRPSCRLRPGARPARRTARTAHVGRGTRASAARRCRRRGRSRGDEPGAARVRPVVLQRCSRDRLSRTRNLAHGRRPHRRVRADGHRRCARRGSAPPAPGTHDGAGRRAGGPDLRTPARRPARGCRPDGHHRGHPRRPVRTPHPRAPPVRPALDQHRPHPSASSRPALLTCHDRGDPQQCPFPPQGRRPARPLPTARHPPRPTRPTHHLHAPARTLGCSARRTRRTETATAQGRGHPPRPDGHRSLPPLRGPLPRDPSRLTALRHHQHPHLAERTGQRHGVPESSPPRRRDRHRARPGRGGAVPEAGDSAV